MLQHADRHHLVVGAGDVAEIRFDDVQLAAQAAAADFFVDEAHLLEFRQGSDRRRHAGLAGQALDQIGLAGADRAAKDIALGQRAQVGGLPLAGVEAALQRPARRAQCDPHRHAADQERSEDDDGQFGLGFPARPDRDGDDLPVRHREDDEHGG